MTTFEPTPLGFSPQFMLENGSRGKVGCPGLLDRPGINLATVLLAPISSPFGSLSAAQKCGVRRPAFTSHLQKEPR